MIVNEIYCYANDFLKWNISRKTGYIVGNKKLFGKICILSLRNKRKSIFPRIISRNQRWKKITTETGKIVIKSTCRWNNRTKFRKWISWGEFVHFSCTIDTSRSRTRWIQFIIFNFIKKNFCFNLSKKRFSEVSCVKVGLYSPIFLLSFCTLWEPVVFDFMPCVRFCTEINNGLWGKTEPVFSL